MKLRKFPSLLTFLILMVIALFPDKSLAASCCGGGSASSLTLPKFSKAMVDLSFDIENYDGFWDQNGKSLPDPPGAKLRQYRLNLGLAYRFADRWQGSVTLPFVVNDNNYPGSNGGATGIGDMSASVWYEFFDSIQCVWKVDKPEDLMPAIYLGSTLTIPTGVSPFDGVASSFDVTGRGFYRVDMNLLLDKTIYPWNATFLFSYGKHIDRPVNKEYGKNVEPYDKNLGDRRLITVSGGYTKFLDSMASVTFTLGYSDLKENGGVINGANDPLTGFRKRSLSLTAAWASFDRDWIAKFSFNKSIRGDDWGENFPITDIVTIGVSHVFR